MKKQLLLFSIMLLATLFSACKQQVNYEKFDLNYSLESAGVYTIDVNINSDKSYKITRNNLFMNRIQDEKPVYVYEGQLDDQEYSRFKQLLSKADLLSMKDAYGFTTETTAKDRDDLLIQLTLKTSEHEKFITIKDDKTIHFSKSFLGLIGFMNDFITANVN